jgi:phosphatidylserine decarboxylase
MRFFIPPIHREGYAFILMFGIASLVFFAVNAALGWMGVVMTAWCVSFFRDPRRLTPVGEQWVVSPADGLVTYVGPSEAPSEFGLTGSFTRISIFLSVFNVHVNRIPVTGRVERLHYHPGKFLSATLDKSSHLNERQSVLLRDSEGRSFLVVQIAGTIARRIVCDLEESQDVQLGQRFGIIRFGSRVDLYLPEGVAPLVSLGQTMVGGETILADLSQPQLGPREGVER